MPGGQYTNLFQQARALGLSDRWAEVCKSYAEVNELFGDIVKVTPTSKAVGDMALFLVANEMSASEVLTSEKALAYPSSVLDLIAGRMGQPPGGFPKPVMKKILGDEPPLTTRPGESMPDADVNEAEMLAAELSGEPPSSRADTQRSMRTLPNTNELTEKSPGCRRPISSTVKSRAKKSRSISRKASG